ncbi:MAG: ABC transporter permease [Mangrovibacterium sp.]
MEKNPFFKVLFREIDRMSGSAIYLFCTLIGPLFAFLLLQATFSKSIPRDIAMAVVDQDRSALSRKIRQSINAAPEAEVCARLTNLKEAYGLMARGKIDAIVLIPQDTEKNILKGMQQKIPAFINNMNILKGGYLQKGVYKTLASLSAGLKIQLAVKKGQNVEQAMVRSVPVRLNQHILFNPFGNYAYFLLTALLPLMILVFTLLTTVYAVGLELREGTGPDWLLHANGNLIVALAGKLLPYTLLYGMVSMVMNVILFIHMETPVHGSFMLIILGELWLILTYQFVGILLVSALANLRLALSIGSAYSMMALTFSGLTFPAFGMPAVAEVLSFLFPFTYWIRIFISQAMQGGPQMQGVKALCCFLPFILLSLLFFPRLKRILQDKTYWGKL